MRPVRELFIKNFYDLAARVRGAVPASGAGATKNSSLLCSVRFQSLRSEAALTFGCQEERRTLAN
jgi:hypothetical protein